MPETLHALNLPQSRGPEIQLGVVVIAGSDGFLRRQALNAVIALAGASPDEVRQYEGDEVAWRDVHDELATVSLFDSDQQRIAVVKSADKWISANRPALERWTDKARTDSMLIIETGTFPATTKLHKLVLKNGTLIDCNPPRLNRWDKPVDEKAVQKWLQSHAKTGHGVLLSAKQSALMMDRVGPEFGLLDCEVAKLALFADAKGVVTEDQILNVVGGWRTQTAWIIADAIANGKIAEALDQLDRLFTSGQNAVGLMAQLAWSLRRFGVAAQLIEQGERVGRVVTVPQALEQAGFRSTGIAVAEKQLRRIGRLRARQIIAWLLELDGKLKGSHSTESRARFALEELVLRFY